ncbi:MULTISPECIES: TetR/AcrR family transcriptional regulator [Acidobacteriaceae]|uniref:TetR/AcrR family transcriptional regulator n=1 Tax=Acidobacteriaceae TaxID=204434 RepID=UPI00131C8D02|nr:MULTISPECIES: TetR/AcrR family transcriptional regulator [Acidobacteriaceae]MDW5267092.1 TetR/AcrR family transcriptional regulator [Edaphobacter sp.]
MSKGEETRLRIVAEAAPLFNQRGYEGCSMQNIMDATGLEKGGIYRHFESKEELAAEAFDFAWAMTSSRRRQNLDSIPNPVDRLKQHIANFVSRSSFPGGCPLLNTAVDSDNGNPVLREKVRKALRGWQSLLQDIIKEGIKDGSIRADVDANQVSNLLIGGLEGGMLISRIERNDQGLRAALEHLDSYIESQVRKTSKAPSKNR